MVVKISLPSDDSADIVARTIEEKIKYRSFYNRIKDDLILQIEFYRAKGGDPKFINPMRIRGYTESDDEADKRKKSLLGLYKPNKDKLPYKQLEKIRKDNGLVICPSCGEAGRPRTLDHYLPKNFFPELAITLLNLTPMCDWCQGEKAESYKTSAGIKKYIHPYFDDVNTPLYKIVFSKPYMTPVINYSINSDLSTELQNLVQTHLVGIGFLNRYKTFFKVMYPSVLRRAAESRIPDNIELKRWLKLLMDMESDKAVNSWDAVLYRSILEDEGILNFLENEKLPEYF